MRKCCAAGLWTCQLHLARVACAVCNSLCVVPSCIPAGSARLAQEATATPAAPPQTTTPAGYMQLHRSTTKPGTSMCTLKGGFPWRMPTFQACVVSLAVVTSTPFLHPLRPVLVSRMVAAAVLSPKSRNLSYMCFDTRPFWDIGLFWDPCRV